MKVVNTYHSPTSVNFSLKCRLTDDRDLEFLVVARSNELDVYAILVDGLSLQCTLDVWGRVTSLLGVGQSETTKQSLLVTTDHPDPRLLLFHYLSGPIPRLECTKSLSLHERNARPSEFFTGAIINSERNIAIISSYVGKLKILKLENGKYDSDFDVSIRELNLLSITFLQTASTQSSIVALLHRDHNQNVVLTSHELSKTELKSSPSSVLPETIVPDPSSSIIIPVPPQGEDSRCEHGGLMVIGDEQITFYLNAKKLKKKTGEGIPNPPRPAKPKSIRWTHSQVTAWAPIDESGSRYVLGDAFGRLVLLALRDDESDPLLLLYLGETSSPTSLTVLPSQFIFVGSHFGDSQLIRIDQTKSSDGSFVEVVDRFKNIAPIVDAVLVNSESTGQAEVVTCSGGKNSGSLRIIRNGVNFAVDAYVDGIHDVLAMWPLKSSSDEQDNGFLLTSTPTGTQLYELPSNNESAIFTRLSEEAFPGFIFNARTLAASNVKRRKQSGSKQQIEYVDSSYVVQVSTDRIHVVDMGTRFRESHWAPSTGTNNGSIVLASISLTHVCVALAGGTIVLFEITEETLEVTRSATLRGKPEVSALALSPPSPALYVIVGLWTDFSLRLLKCPDLKEVSYTGPLASLPRSLLVTEFKEGTEKISSLFIGQADGRVVEKPFSEKDFKPDNAKILTLGDSPVMLTGCNVDGRPAVLASGSRSTLFSWKKGAISVSPLHLKDTITAATINSQAYQSSLVLASPKGLTIGRVLQIEKLHVRSIPMGLDNPVRIAYQDETKTFGIGRISTDLSPGSVETSRSSFIIMDAVTYTLSHSYDLDNGEEVTSVEALSLNDGNISTPFYAVGTMYHDPSEREPTRGRLLLFTRSNKSLPVIHRVCEMAVNGCVFSVACMKGKLVAAVNSGVYLYELASSETGAKELVKLCEWNHNYIVTSISTDDDRLVTGDAISSIAVLELKDSKFVTRTRDYGPLWPLSVSLTEKSSIIGSNSDNMFSFRIRELPEERLILDQDGDFRIDEIVNKFVPGRLSSRGTTTTNSKRLTPKHIYFTSTGRIGVVSETSDDEQSVQLINLLRNLTYVVQGPGNITYADRRSPVSPRGKSDGHPIQGFIDGDFLERFLDFEPRSREVQKILEGKTAAEKLKLTSQQIRSILETLKSFH